MPLPGFYPVSLTVFLACTPPAACVGVDVTAVTSQYDQLRSDASSATSATNANTTIVASLLEQFLQSGSGNNGSVHTLKPFPSMLFHAMFSYRVPTTRELCLCGVRTRSVMLTELPPSTSPITFASHTHIIHNCGGGRHLVYIHSCTLHYARPCFYHPAPLVGLHTPFFITNSCSGGINPV